MHSGTIGGIAGGVLGLAGGILGTWMAIRNTGGPRERGFMIRAAAVTWVGLLGFLAALLLLPVPWRYLAWLPYCILLPLSIRYVNRRQGEIRTVERAGG